MKGSDFLKTLLIGIRSADLRGYSLHQIGNDADFPVYTSSRQDSNRFNSASTPIVLAG